MHVSWWVVLLRTRRGSLPDRERASKAQMAPLLEGRPSPPPRKQGSSAAASERASERELRREGGRKEGSYGGMCAYAYIHTYILRWRERER